MNLHLQDRIVFIAGSSRGIGKAIASTLLEEGCRVALSGRDPVSLQETATEFVALYGPNRVIPFPGDLTNPAVIAQALSDIVTQWGQIDHLICNLGTGSGKPGWNQSEDEWQRLFNLNFFGSTRLAQAAIPHLEHSTASPSILFLSSIVAVEATPAPLPYSAAKAALANYSKNLARTLAPNIRVNTIAPGNIFFSGGSWERHLANRREAVENMLATEVPLHRFGTPEEIAALAALLCSPRSVFTTGSTFIADGGQTRSL
jgi:3-oxoacyl-[acyl-carrier protein] reductase